MRDEFIQNKIGFLPPDQWELTKLGKITEINIENISTKANPEKGIFYIDLGAVDEGTIDLPDEPIQFKNAPSRARRVIHENDVLLSTVRPYLKGFAQIDRNIEGYICSTGFAVLTPDDSVDSKYIYHSLYTETFQRQFEQLLVGSNYPAINNSDVEKLFIALPTEKDERKEIVQILERWEKAISILEKLIKAKKRYKKGLMQQLFSGKKRFPEFEGGGWQEVKLKKFFKYYSNKNKDDEDLSIMSCSKVHGITKQKNIFDKRIASKDVSDYKIIEKYDLVYDPMLLWDASIGFVKEVDRGIISPAYYTFKFKEGSAYRPFFEFVFGTHYMKYNYKAISQGTNTRRRKAPREAFLKIPIKIPKSIEEQKKIADTLLAAQKEIDLLEQELEAVKKQKKGLMQKLLTGKVRVNRELTKYESYA